MNLSTTMCFLSAASILWGSSPALLKIIVPSLGPSWTAESRLILAAVLATLFLALQGKRLALRQYWYIYAVGGLLNVGLPYWLNSYAVQSISASTLASFNALSPLFASALAQSRDGKFSVRVTCGLLLGTAGVYLITTSIGSVGAGNWLGVTAALFAAASIALGAVYTGKFVGEVGLEQAVSGNLVMASLLMVPSLMVSKIPDALPLDVAAALVALASLSTVVPFLLYFQLIAKRGPQVAVLVNYLIPIFGVLWSSLLLRENFETQQGLGLGTILLGVLMLVAPQKPPSAVQ